MWINEEELIKETLKELIQCQNLLDQIVILNEGVNQTTKKESLLSYRNRIYGKIFSTNVLLENIYFKINELVERKLKS